MKNTSKRLEPISTEELYKIFSSASNSSEALAALYKAFKEIYQQFSLAYVIKRLGLSSRGYLSEVLAGKKVLGMSFYGKVAGLFQLDDLTRQTLFVLMKRDNSRNPERRSALDADLVKLQNLCKTKVAQLRADSPQKAFFAITVFCAFGLFKNKPTRTDLIQYFGKHNYALVESALGRLLSWNLVRCVDDKFEVLSDQIRFNESEDGITHLGYLDCALRECRDLVPFWFDKPDLSYIDAQTISVKKSNYIERLSALRLQLRSEQRALESSDGDLLVRFNVQIFPLSS